MPSQKVNFLLNLANEMSQFTSISSHLGDGCCSDVDSGELCWHPHDGWNTFVSKIIHEKSLRYDLSL